MDAALVTRQIFRATFITKVVCVTSDHPSVRLLARYLPPPPPPPPFQSFFADPSSEAGSQDVLGRAQSFFT